MMVMLKNKKQTKRWLIVGLVATLIVIGVISLFRSNSSRQADKNTAPGQGINFGLSSDDKKRSEDNKKRIDERQAATKDQPSQQPGTKKTVKPVITYVGQYGQSVEVGGYVTGVFEDGGSCTATFKLGSSSFTKSVSSVKNATSVDCPVMSADVKEFTQKGFWSVFITYTSVSASGSSEARQVEVK